MSCFLLPQLNSIWGSLWSAQLLYKRGFFFFFSPPFPPFWDGRFYLITWTTLVEIKIIKNWILIDLDTARLPCRSCWWHCEEGGMGRSRQWTEQCSATCLVKGCASCNSNSWDTINSVNWLKTQRVGQSLHNVTIAILKGQSRRWQWRPS